jgi:hypothetical protein
MALCHVSVGEECIVRRAPSSLSPQERAGVRDPVGPGIKPLTLTLSQRERGHDNMSKSVKVT